MIFRMRMDRRPKPKQSARFVRGHAFVDSAVKEYSGYVAEQTRMAMQRCKIPGKIGGNIIIHRLLFVFSLPKNATMEAKAWCARSDHHLIYRPTTPDIDNLQKMVLDGMKGVLFDDDGSVVAYQGTVGTFYGRKEYTEVLLSTTLRNSFECVTLQELTRSMIATEAPL